MAADLVVFDADTIGARMPDVVHDLPAGAKASETDGGRYSQHRREWRDLTDEQRTQRRCARSFVTQLVKIKGIADMPLREHRGWCNIPLPRVSLHARQRTCSSTG